MAYLTYYPSICSELPKKNPQNISSGQLVSGPSSEHRTSKTLSIRQCVVQFHFFTVHKSACEIPCRICITSLTLPDSLEQHLGVTWCCDTTLLAHQKVPHLHYLSHTGTYFIILQFDALHCCFLLSGCKYNRFLNMA